MVWITICPVLLGLSARKLCIQALFGVSVEPTDAFLKGHAVHANLFRQFP